MGNRRALLLVLSLLPLGGCYTFCDGKALLASAKEGKVSAIHETGEFGDPVIPVTKAQLPTMPDVYAALEPHLAADDAFTRLMALESVRRLSARTPSLYRDRYQGLIDPLLSDSDPEIRWRAAWALGRLRRTCEGLRQASLDPNDRVAERAVWALAEVRDEKASPFLLRAIERPALLEEGARALRRITGIKIGADLQAWQRAAEAGGIKPVPAPDGGR